MRIIIIIYSGDYLVFYLITERGGEWNEIPFTLVDGDDNDDAFAGCE